MRLRFQFVSRFAIAAILLFAAAFKLHAVVLGYIDTTGYGFLSWLITAAALVEVSVAWSLFWFTRRALPILCALILFCMFSIVAFTGWVAHRADCGCFGVVEIAPLAALSIDIACLALLWLARPQPFADHIASEARIFWSRLTGWRSAARVVATCATLVLISFLLGTDTGRQLVLLPESRGIIATTSDVGAGAAGEWVSGNIYLTNTTATSARVIGDKTTCGCIAGVERREIPAHERVPVAFRVVRPAGAGSFHKSLTLFVDHPNQYFVVAEITGRVQPAAAGQNAGLTVAGQ